MLKHISLSNFRNYQNLSIDTDSDIIILYGTNGQGKTNFLESVYYLALLRSFRVSTVKSLKQISTNGFYISGTISTTQKWDRDIEVEYLNGKRKLKIDSLPIPKSGDFIRFIKPVVFSHEDLNIITDSSKLRRRYIDIFISSIDLGYFNALREYMVALKSRNAILKKPGIKNLQILAAFEPILAKNAYIIINKRYEILDKLKFKTQEFLKEIKGNSTELDIKYISKFKYKEFTEQDFLGQFQRDREKDIKRGFTGTGPHSEDIDFIYSGKSLRFFGSLGQCRITSLCLKMSEVKIVREYDNTGNIIALIDDVTGELDSKTKDSFFNTVSDADQLIFTLTDQKKNDSYFDNALQLSVKEGEIKQI